MIHEFISGYGCGFSFNGKNNLATNIYDFKWSLTTMNVGNVDIYRFWDQTIYVIIFFFKFIISFIQIKNIPLNVSLRAKLEEGLGELG